MKRNTILVLEDDPSCVKAFGNVAKKAGGDIDLVFKNIVPEAVKFYEENQESISCVLCDYDLTAGGIGVDFMRKIKKIQDVKYYANSTEKENNKKLIKAGCDDIVGKDFIKLLKIFTNIKNAITL